jgi:hypothetical protein
MPDSWRHAGCASDNLTQLAGDEASKHRDHAVVSGHGVEPKWKARQPETGRSEPAAPQVGNDDAGARHAIELAHETLEILIGEVMQQLGTDHDVDAAIAKGK